MSFCLSTCRADPAANYLFTRVRRTQQEIRPGLQTGLHVVYLQVDRHLVPLYPWGKICPATNAKWECWSQLEKPTASRWKTPAFAIAFTKPVPGRLP